MNNATAENSDAKTETEIPTLTFENGLPGFPDARTFALLNTELAQDPFAILRCLDSDCESLEFVVVPPGLFFPEYAPIVDDATVRKLSIEDAQDVLVLSILTVGETAASITANLLAPVIINTVNRMAAQVVLTTQDFPIDAPLFSEDVLVSAKNAAQNTQK